MNYHRTTSGTSLKVATQQNNSINKTLRLLDLYNDWYKRMSEDVGVQAVNPGSKPVGVRGSLMASYMFIGEAPGAEEEKEGKPFVGASGKILDEWIAHLGLGDTEFVIANTVFVRPPNNRDPTVEEVASCAPHLEELTKLINPDVIVLVGRFAMNRYFPEKKAILNESGKLIISKSQAYYIVPHPSYFLRQGGKGWEPYLTQLREITQTRKNGKSETA